MKKIILISLFATVLFASEGTMNLKIKYWGFDNFGLNDLRVKKDKQVIKNWFFDKSADMVIVNGLKERGTLRQLSLPYKSYYAKFSENSWQQLLRASKNSEKINVKKLSYPDTEGIFTDSLQMYHINNDIVIAVVDFEKKGFEKMKAFFNYVMPYYERKKRIDKGKFVLVGNIFIKKENDYKKLKKYYDFKIDEGTKIIYRDNKFKMKSLGNVVVVKNSDIIKKSYVDYGLLATKKYGKKNIGKYVKNVSSEYPYNFVIKVKKKEK